MLIKEKDLCSHFSVTGITYVILHPGRRQTDNRVGATPEKYVQIIEEQLLK